MRRQLLIAGAVLLGANALSAQEAQRAAAEMKDPQGKSLGRVTLTQTPNGVLVKGDLSGLPDGEHAIHLHQKGTCSPSFEAAGEHFDPQGREHGFLDPKGPHAGDLPNIHVPENGRIAFEMRATGFSLSAGKTSLFDPDGTAVIIHARPDDYRTDPSGGAGDRIACGVIERATAGKR